MILIVVYRFHSKAFEQAKKSPGCIFGKTGDIDIEKIKKSKYFQALLKEKVENQLVIIIYADKRTSSLFRQNIVNLFLLFSHPPHSC